MIISSTANSPLPQILTDHYASGAVESTGDSAHNRRNLTRDEERQYINNYIYTECQYFVGPSFAFNIVAIILGIDFMRY